MQSTNGARSGAASADDDMLGWEAIMARPAKVDWILPDVLPANSRAMAYGDSGVGKSQTFTSIACHVATGKPWRGKPVKQGTVYYIAVENPEAFPATAQAWDKMYKGAAYWEKHHKREGETVPPLHLIDKIDLSSPDSVSELLKRLGPAVLVIIDTLQVAMGDFDILRPNDNYRTIRQINRIRERTGATVLVVHHSQEGGIKPLGGTGVRGGYQVRMRLERYRGKAKLGEQADFQDGDRVTLTCEKMTRGRKFDQVSLPVQMVHVMRDVDVPMIAPAERSPAGLSQSAAAIRKRRSRMKVTENDAA
jgi:putative DNA primase/helicase